MENFAFGNLTHRKGLVLYSAKMQFINKLCFQKLIRIHFSNKGALFYATESPLIMMKNAVYFALKSLFALKIFKILS